MIWHLHFLAETSGGIGRVKSLHDDAAIFAGGLQGFFAANATGEVAHLLGNAVVPMLFEDGITPTLGAGRFFDGVTETVFTVSWKSVAHVEVGVSDATFADRFRCGLTCRRDGPNCFR